MTEHHSVVEYLSGPEELTRKELVWGIVREPAAPTCSHQAVVGRTLVVLATYAARHALGRVLVSPVDVVLDEQKALVLQPDIVFVAGAREGIVRDRIWGAPDLVVEVLSPGTRRRDTSTKRRWYQRYGVREYFIIDPVEDRRGLHARRNFRSRAAKDRARARAGALERPDGIRGTGTHVLRVGNVAAEAY